MNDLNEYDPTPPPLDEEEPQADSKLLKTLTIGAGIKDRGGRAKSNERVCIRLFAEAWVDESTLQGWTKKEFTTVPPTTTPPTTTTTTATTTTEPTTTTAKATTPKKTTAAPKTKPVPPKPESNSDEAK